MSAFGPKADIACTSFDTGLAVLDTPYQEHHRHGPPMAQASVAESLVALPPVKGAHHDHSQNPPEARLAAQRLEDDREAKANLLAKANEYDYLAACNKGKEFEIPSATMLIGGAAVRRH